MNKFSKILIGILVLPILIFGAEKKYNKSVNFPTLVFNYNKIDKKSKSELENIIDEIEKYKNDSQKIKIVVTAYTTDVAEDNADYVVETLEKSFKKKRITTRSLIAKDEDDATRNVSITLYMKIESDKDGDGVHIDNDKCPDTLANVKVDLDGCKIPDKDEDKDGILIDIDKCPNTIAGAEVDVNGCRITDKDGDGVHIDDDKCPMTLAYTEVGADGCRITDKDEDGIHVDLDKCPNTIAGAEVDSQGCRITDKDEDGIHIDSDRCPNTPLKAKVGDNGCQLKTVYCIVNSKTKTMRMVSELDDIKKGESVVTLYLDENGLYGDSEQDIQKIILNLLK